MLAVDIEKQLQFIGEIEKLKVIYRQNGIIDRSRYENSAEHSGHIALLAVVLADRCDIPDLNLLNIVKMLLIHDIVEIDAGDNFTFDAAEMKKVEEKEREAALRIFGMLPETQCHEFFQLWQEFNERKTTDARYARAMDGIQPLVNHLLTTEENENPLCLTKTMILSMKSYIKDVSPVLWDIVTELIDRSVKKGLYWDE